MKKEGPLGFERKSSKLLPIRDFYKRLLNNALIAAMIILLSIILGVWGYTHYAHLEFPDALLNASMILSGMGPVDTLHDNAAKYFASFYALFSGITFLTTVGLLFAPILHRLMHKFHLESE
jgi:hypothetical protein